jgi:hypothetical protein
MKKTFAMAVFAFVLSFLTVSVYADEAWYKDYRISGPYTYKNLSIYLVHGNDTVDAGDYMTLEEAMDAGVLKINETGNVNALQLVNRSKRKIFIQSGDIIKGGRQDRVIKNDLIINVNSGIVNINVFCVEHGRWQKRGFEDAGHFSSSRESIATKGLKLAAKDTQSQQDVWNEVSRAQDKLEKSVGAPVTSNESSSSLLLTLENKDVEKLSDEYVDAIENKVSGQRDVVGYVFAINGGINSCDIYGNRTLFEKMWSKQIKASAVEAVSETDNGGNYGSPGASDIASWLDSTGGSNAEEKQVDSNNVSVEKDSDADMSYESYEAAAPSKCVHQEIIKK